MDYKLQDMEKGAVLSLSGDMTIRNGQALREVLFRTIGDKEALFLDLTSAGEVDVRPFNSCAPPTGRRAI